MFEMEAHFVRATDAQIREALGDPIATHLLPDKADKALAVLKANKAEFFSNPQAITRSGKRATVEALRELRYPTNFEPSKKEPGKARPTEFGTRKFGVTMAFEPVAAPDGMIDVGLEASVETFHGFIDYSNGKPGLNSAEPGALEELLKAPLREGGIWQPIFYSQKITTGASIGSGQTVVLPILHHRVPEDVRLGPEEATRKDVNIYVFVTVRTIAAE